MGYILLCLLVPGAVAGNKNNKEINTAPVYTTVSPRVTNKKYTPPVVMIPAKTNELDAGKKYPENYLIYVELWVPPT